MLWLVDSLVGFTGSYLLLPAGQSVVADCATGGFDRRGCLLSADGSGCGEAIAAAAAQPQIPAAKTEAAEENAS